jgi:hypothetical protein
VTAWTISRPGASEIVARAEEFEDAYFEAYSEPPYGETAEQAAEFARGLMEQADAGTGLDMVMAIDVDSRLAGFAYGVAFPSDKWWRSASTEPELTRGHPKFAVIELVVRLPWRGQHLGTALITSLLSGRTEPFATLCSNPDAYAHAVYLRWGWTIVGSTNPPGIAPMDVLVRDLRSR